MPLLPIVPMLLVAALSLCRYTVRDIGFVDLRGPTYSLRINPAGMPQAQADAIGRAVGAALLNSNVQVMVERAGSHADTPAARATLHGPGGHTLEIDADGHEDALVQAARALVWSPTHRELASLLPTSFAVAIVHDPGARLGLADAARQAFADLRELEPLLPRPIFGELALVELGDDPGSAAIRWAMQIPERGGVAVVYGRGKRAGPPVASAAGVDELLAQLSLIGDSCECETPRDWTAEPTLPLRWTGVTHDQAADALGFDPKSPMVKAEVVRILARGPQTAARTPRVAGDAASVLLGYSEFAVDSPPPPSSPPSPSPRPAPVSAAATGGTPALPHTMPPQTDLPKTETLGQNQTQNQTQKQAQTQTDPRPTSIAAAPEPPAIAPTPPRQARDATERAADAPQRAGSATPPTGLVVGVLVLAGGLAGLGVMLGWRPR